MLKNLAFFICLLRTSIRASISRRGAFIVEAGLMVMNNLIFFAIWWIFFRQFDDVGGWNFTDMAVLMAIGLGSYGLMQVCFGGVRNLSKIIVNGDLDPFMTQPKNLLLHVVCSKSHSKGWGHLMTAAFLIFFGGMISFSSLLLVVLSIVSGCIVFTSINIIVHSLPFWIGACEGVAKKYCDALFLFSLYPTNIYSGLIQVIMFTVIPAGMITYLPVELMRNFSWVQLSILAGGSIGFLSSAFMVFYWGLQRYESGNKFGMRV